MVRNDERSLTYDERQAQGAPLNLADAHARQPMSDVEKQHILAEFPEIFRKAGEAKPADLERLSATTFLSSLGQKPADDVFVRALYSSSVATMVVARYLRRTGRDVSLTHPTFDNLFALLDGEGVVVHPRPAGAGGEPLGEDAPACIFEVSPNNPTGHVIDEAALERLAAQCAESGRLLVLDQSFKGHVKSACFDHYAVLQRSGADFIVIEDTGKLWPTLDLKVAFLVATPSIGGALARIVDDILLNTSEFILQLVVHYSEFSSDEDYATIRRVIETNRALLQELVSDFPELLSRPYPESGVGVEVIDVARDRYERLLAVLDENEVAVLPTDKFYWVPGCQPPGAQLRIALCRDPEDFTKAVGTVRDAIKNTTWNS